jgi:hypothetical protein
MVVYTCKKCGDSSLRTNEGVRRCATEGNDYGVISGTLDGVEIKNLDGDRVDWIL